MVKSFPMIQTSMFSLITIIFQSLKAFSKDIYFLKENLLHAIFNLRYVKLLVVTKCSLYTLSSMVHTGNIERIRPVVAYKRLKTLLNILKKCFSKKWLWLLTRGLRF